MTTLLDPAPPQEYAPEPPRRGVSRGRKALIGLMAIAAVGAVSGGGTFASFSASTDNSATNAFRTATFALGNKVEDSATQCLSTAGTNNANTCEALFPDMPSSGMVAGTTYKTGVVIENVGDAAGDLSVFAVSQTGEVSCVVTVGDTQNLCGKIQIKIQEYAVDTNTDNVGEPGAGATVAAWDDTESDQQFEVAGTPLKPVARCVFDSTNAVNTSASCATDGGFLSSFPLFASKLATHDHAGTNIPHTKVTPNEDVRYFQIEAKIAYSSTVAGCSAAITGFGTNGVGCTNEINDGGATFVLRWLLQEV